MNDEKHMMANRIVALLNELVTIDKPMMAALIANRVPCSKTLAFHPTVQVTRQHGGYHIGLLGLLNGLCEHDGFGPIAAVFQENPEGQGLNDLKMFVVHEEPW